MVDRLDRDTLITRLARPRGPWARVVVHDTTGSTNDDAERQAQPYLLVVSAEQTAGRGRRARAWSSPPGTSVSMSLVLPLVVSGGIGPGAMADPAGVGGGMRDPGWIPLVVGLGVRDALAGLIGAEGARVVLKWPNDVLVEGASATSAPTRGSGGGSDGGSGGGSDGGSDRGSGREQSGESRPEVPAKISGILCQLVPDKGLVVAGVGINVTVPVEALPVPEGTAAPATSLHLCRAERPITREAVVEAVATHVERRHAAWLAGGAEAEELRREYRSACVTVGSLVDVHLPGGEVRRARATGVADGGELRIADEAGAVSLVRAGDVIHIRPRLGA